MKNILLYQAAGAGDLINFTGILLRLHQTYNCKFDFLVRRKHRYILEAHPGVDNVLAIEDYPEIPDFCTKQGHDVMVQRTFKDKYKRILNVWGIKSRGPHTGDFVFMMNNLMHEYGLGVPFERKTLSPVFFYTQADIDKVTQYNSLDRAKTILIEDESFSWVSPQLQLLPSIHAMLRDKGYLIASNGNVCQPDISVKDLNLKQIRLFMQEHCKGFIGLSSGMTCALYSLPTAYTDHILLVSGIYDGWNIEHIVNSHNLNICSYFKPTVPLDVIKNTF